MGQLLGRDLAVTADTNGVAQIGHVPHRAAHLRKLGQSEAGRTQDRLVADAHGFQTRLDVGARAGLRGADDGWGKAVVGGVSEEGAGRRRPHRGVTEGVSRGQCHAHGGAVDHAAVLGEDRGLVPAGGEVAQGVSRVVRQESADAQLFLGVDLRGLVPGLHDEPQGRQRAQGPAQAHGAEEPVRLVASGEQVEDLVQAHTSHHEQDIDADDGDGGGAQDEDAQGPLVVTGLGAHGVVAAVAQQCGQNDEENDDVGRHRAYEPRGQRLGGGLRGARGIRDGVGDE